MSDRDQIEDLLAAYAIGAVDAEERRAVERALIDDPSLSAVLDRHLATAAALTEGLLAGDETPPAAVWRRIEGALTAGAQPARPARRPWRVRTISAVAAVAVAAAAVLAVQVVRQRAELSDLRTDPLALAVEEARDAGARPLPLTGEVSAEVVLGADGTGYLIGDALPALDASQTYQLWAVVDGRVISAGVLGPDPAIAAFHVDGDVSALALTVEIAGGVAVSDQPVVAAAALDA
jgi:anti-sigma-K factor RskA